MTEKFMGKAPEISATAWVHPAACVIGQARLSDGVSVWPGAVIRADVDRIEVGAGTNIQDLAVLHPNRNRPVILGLGVTVGHSAVIHGSLIGDHCLIGMGAVVMDSEIGEQCIVAAGAVVPPGSKIPPRRMVMGLPGRAVRALGEDEIKGLFRSEQDYLELTALYRKEHA